MYFIEKDKCEDFRKESYICSYVHKQRCFIKKTVSKVTITLLKISDITFDFLISELKRLEISVSKLEETWKSTKTLLLTKLNRSPWYHHGDQGTSSNKISLGLRGPILSVPFKNVSCQILSPMCLLYWTNINRVHLTWNIWQNSLQFLKPLYETLNGAPKWTTEPLKSWQIKRKTYKRRFALVMFQDACDRGFHWRGKHLKPTFLQVLLPPQADTLWYNRNHVESGVNLSHSLTYRK